MRSDSVNQAFARRARTRHRRPGVQAAQRSASRPRMPSSSGYMLATGAAAGALFFLLWFMLHNNGDEAPWVPAGLAASVVMLVAVAAREVVMRRAWARYLLEYDRREQAVADAQQRTTSTGGVRARSTDAHSFSLRALQRQSTEANAPGALPEAHLETYLSCQEYLEGTEEALRGGAVNSESRVTLRAGQERARTLARHHLLSWARGASRSLTHEAQRRARLSDKIETAGRALDVIESALGVYPDEAELKESEAAVREFMASAKVSHWVELAERAAFKGRYARAIDRYRDALFYLSREPMREEARAEAAERIGREIEMLRARLQTRKINLDPTPHEPEKSSHGVKTG